MTAGTGNEAGVRAADDAVVAAPAQGPGPADDQVSTIWRGIVLVSVISLFIGAYASWADPWTELTIMVGYGGILACAVLAVTARRPAGMRRLEYGVLGLAIMLYITSMPRLFPAHGGAYGGDEGTLTDLAGTALRSRSDPYALSWPHMLNGRHGAVTLTLSGHVISQFQYPPLSVILDALVKPLTAGLPTAGVLDVVVLGITSVLMFFLLPSPWRTVAPMILLGFPIYERYARLGEPVFLALPFLLLVLYRWTSIGSGGRLGRAGWISAVCLGLAGATQQLVWFIVPFVLLAIFLLRRSDAPAPAAVRLACGYTAVAAAAFIVVNIPFMIWNFGDWLRGIISPLTQGGIPNGPGLIGITYYLTGGSGALGFYDYAALAYAVALLACFGLYFRRLGPAVAILPWTIFLFTRSQAGYFLLFAALWVISLLTSDHRVFARAHEPGGRLRQRLRLDSRAATIAVAALFVPTVACLGIAIGTPQPLSLTVAQPAVTRRGHVIATLKVRATNMSGHDIAPHFALSGDPGTSVEWVIKAGPATLAPGATAIYVIRPPYAAAAAPTSGPIKLRAFSGSPDTVSSATVPIGTGG